MEGLLYAVLYALSCVAKHFSSFSVLLAGRVLGGVATSLLFTVFECWVVCEHAQRGFPAPWLSETLAIATSGNAVVGWGRAPPPLSLSLSLFSPRRRLKHNKLRYCRCTAISKYLLLLLRSNQS